VVGPTQHVRTGQVQRHTVGSPTQAVWIKRGQVIGSGEIIVLTPTACIVSSNKKNKERFHSGLMDRNADQSKRNGQYKLVVSFSPGAFGVRLYGTEAIKSFYGQP